MCQFSPYGRMNCDFTPNNVRNGGWHLDQNTPEWKMKIREEVVWRCVSSAGQSYSISRLTFFIWGQNGRSSTLNGVSSSWDDSCCVLYYYYCSSRWTRMLLLWLFEFCYKPCVEAVSQAVIWIFPQTVTVTWMLPPVITAHFRCLRMSKSNT